MDAAPLTEDWKDGASFIGDWRGVDEKAPRCKNAGAYHIHAYLNALDVLFYALTVLQNRIRKWLVSRIIDWIDDQKTVITTLDTIGAQIVGTLNS